MTRRGWAVIGVAVTMLAVCVLSMVALYGTLGAVRRSGVPFRIGNFGNTPATERTTSRYPVGGQPRLVVDTAAGGITVTVGADDVIAVETVKTARGRDAAAARDRWQDLRVETKQEGDTVSLSYQPESGVVVGGRREADRVSFNITAPRAVVVALTTGAGPIRLVGTRGGGEIQASFGDVTLANVGGPIKATSQAGEVSAEGVRSDGQVSLDSDFGDVVVKDIQAAELKAATQSGTVTVRDASITGTLTATSQFGRIALTATSAADYAVETSNGEIQASDVRQTGARGALRLHSDFGAIQVTGAQDVALDLVTANGDVDFAGTVRGDRPHTLESRFGDVRAAIPADSRFDVLLATDFGKVSSDLPVTMRGQLSGQRIEGTLNGGGPLLSLTTTNGDVRLERLGAIERR